MIVAPKSVNFVYAVRFRSGANGLHQKASCLSPLLVWNPELEMLPFASAVTFTTVSGVAIAFPNGERNAALPGDQPVPVSCTVVFGG